MRQMKCVTAILFMLCILLTACTDEYTDNAKQSSLVITQWLDSNSFDHTMDSLTIKIILKNVMYNSKPISDDLYGGFVDGAHGGGVISSNTNYGYSDFWQKKNNVINYETHFFTRVDLEGLPLPFDLRMGSSIDTLLAAFDVNATITNSSKNVTLAELENTTVKYIHDAPTEYQSCIELTQVYHYRNSSGNTASVIRTGSFHYDKAKTLKKFSVSIEEIYPSTD